MPIYRKKDRNGPFYQYGKNGKKYYYISGNKRSRRMAINKALRQNRAIHFMKLQKVRTIH